MSSIFNFITLRFVTSYINRFKMMNGLKIIQGERQKKPLYLNLQKLLHWKIVPLKKLVHSSIDSTFTLSPFSSSAVAFSTCCRIHQFPLRHIYLKHVNTFCYKNPFHPKWIENQKLLYGVHVCNLISQIFWQPIHKMTGMFTMQK